METQIVRDGIFGVSFMITSVSRHCDSEAYLLSVAEINSDDEKFQELSGISTGGAEVGMDVRIEFSDSGLNRFRLI